MTNTKAIKLVITAIIISCKLLLPAFAEEPNTNPTPKPKLEYLGGANESEESKELIQKIYRIYQSNGSSQEGKLDPFRFKPFPGQGAFDKLNNGEWPTIRATFSDNTVILVGDHKDKIIIWKDNPYTAQAYGLRNP
jgi:hypothetical protein